MSFKHSRIENLILSRIKQSKAITVDINELARREKDMSIVIVGVSDKYKNEINIVLANVRVIDNYLDFDLELLNNVNLILLNTMNGNYALSYKIERIANQKKIPVRNLSIKGNGVSLGYISETVMYSFIL